MRHLINICLVVMLCAVCGCESATVPVTNLAQSRLVAVQVLDAWKSGSKMEDLKSHSSPIVVSDDLWRNKVSLLSYEILDDGELQGTNARWLIKLFYSDARGKKKEQSFHYLITTTPATTFFREER